jgi:DNA repair protein RecO (recombination protein O)
MSEIKEKITYQSSGIILKTKNLREKDKLITIYTSDFGKIQAKAIGAKKISSKMAGHLEPITESSLAFAKGKILDTIIGATAINNFSEIKKKLESQAAAYYVLELINEFTEFSNPDEKIYCLLKKTMEMIDNLDLKTTLRIFEVKFLKYLGFQPELNHCVVCQKKLKPQKNYLSGQLGGVLCPFCCKNDFNSKPISAEAIKVLKFFNRSSFDLAEKLKIEKKLEKELEKLSVYFLEFILERRIKSKDFLREILNGNNNVSRFSS